MTPYRLTPAAEQDLADLIEHVARGSPRNALKVFDRIHAAARRLAGFPGLGHAREDVTDKPVRFWAVHAWLIVYRADRKPLEILRIVHGSRELARVLQLDEATGED